MITTVINGQEFGCVGSETRGGKVLKEIYFATDRSNVKVEIDYTYTTKGHK